MKTLHFILALLALPAARAQQIDLGWNDNSTNESGFEIHRSVNGGAFVLYDAVGAGTVAYVDAAVTRGSAYGYRVRAFNSAGNSAFSNTATATIPPAGTPPSAPGSLQLNVTLPGELVNISSRGQVDVGAGIVIGGFVVQGGPVQVLLRAVGPTLGTAPYNVPGVLADPQLVLLDATAAELGRNDDWSGLLVAQAAARAGAFPLPSGSKDAALLVTLNPGTYTVHLSGVGSATGVALLEVYAVPPQP